MNKIMELANAYANEKYADGHAHLAETPNTAKARAALQAEVEKIEAENADHIQQLRKDMKTITELTDDEIKEIALHFASPGVSFARAVLAAQGVKTK